MPQKSVLKGNERCPNIPTLIRQNTTGNYCFRVRYYPKKRTKASIHDIYAIHVSKDFKQWKSEDAAKVYESAVWLAYQNNTTILDEYQKIQSVGKRKANSVLERAVSTTKKLSCAENSQIKAMKKEDKLNLIKRNKEEHRAEIWTAVWDNPETTQLKNMTKSIAKARANRRYKRMYKHDLITDEETSLERSIRYLWTSKPLELQAKILALEKEVIKMTTSVQKYNNCWEYILPNTKSMDYKEIGVQVDDEVPYKKRENYTQAALSRVQHQVIIVAKFLSLLRERFVKELDFLINTKSTLDIAKNHNEKQEMYDVLLDQFRQMKIDHCQPRLAGKLADEYTDSFQGEHAVPHAAKTILAWYNDYVQSNYQGFSPDGRGTWKRDVFLETHDLTGAFKAYMRNTKALSVDSTRKWLINKLVERASDKRLDGLADIIEVHEKINISHITVQRWMHLYGAKYCTVTKTYYTDNHNRPDIVEERDTVYIPKRLDLMRRQACWVEVPKDKATTAALNFVKKVRGLGEEDEVPTYTRVSDGAEVVRVSQRVLTKDKYQLAIEIDSSSGHLARAPDALHKRSLKWGGKQLPMRSSVVNENCLDLTNVRYPATLKPGDTAYHQFRDDDPPPFLTPKAPKNDLKWSTMTPLE